MYTVDQRRQNLVIPSNTLSTMEKVLGIVWDPMLDELQYKVQLKTVIKNKRKKPDQQDMKMLDIVNNPSKRTILAQVNSIYDPLAWVSRTLHSKSKNPNETNMGGCG